MQASTQPRPPEAWPIWARLTLAVLFVLVLLVVLPWLFMWSAMAASCLPMMNGMGGGMMPGPMR